MKNILTVLLLALIPTVSYAAITIVDNDTHHGHVTCGGSSTCTTAAIDTTGGTLYVGVIVQYLNAGNAAIAGSLGNTLVQAGVEQIGNHYVHIFYLSAPTTGASETFSCGDNFEWCSVSIWKGTDTVTPLDGSFVGNNCASCLTVSPGSITPAFSGDLVVTGWVSETALGGSSGLAIDSSFTILDSDPTGASYTPGAMAYRIYNSTAAISPTWSETFGNAALGAGMVAFKAAPVPVTGSRSQIF